jgi:adenylate cyclase
VGHVTVGAIGGDGRLEYAVIGDAVNRAAKLQALTKTIVARALVTGVAWTAALEQGFQPRRRHQRHRGCALPGLADPMELIALG